MLFCSVKRLSKNMFMQILLSPKVQNTIVPLQVAIIWDVSMKLWSISSLCH